MCRALQEIEANGEKKGEKNARSDDLKKLVSNAGWSLDRAIETLDISQEEWEDYRSLVQQSAH